ncbi:MAG: hypothetical protein ACHWZW_19635 [Spirulina sp.]
MSNPRVAADHYDPNLIPAETAARKEREGEVYKQVPTEAEGSLDTRGGYTVDQEGLVNNYAIEPEMYIETPGDLQAEEILSEQRREQELKEVNQTDETGKVTPGSDSRGKGVGLV